MTGHTINIEREQCSICGLSLAFLEKWPETSCSLPKAEVKKPDTRLEATIRRIIREELYELELRKRKARPVYDFLEI